MSPRFQQLVQLPRRALSLLVHGSGRIERLASDTKRASKIGVETAKVTTQIGKRTRKLESEVGGLTKNMRTLTTDVQSLTSELRQLREDLSGRLLHYNLQLGRLSRIATDDDAAEGGSTELEQIVERSVAERIAEFDADGKLHLIAR